MEGLMCLAVQCLKIKWERVVKLEAWCLWTVVVYIIEVHRWCHGGTSAEEDVPMVQTCQC